ncbi:MAG: hypothetical protein NC403_09170 [Muribaculaceae bacterium]|nr:hypothetical protein [Muribaculaceae bacterium]
MEVPTQRNLSAETIKTAHAQRIAEMEQRTKAAQPIAGLSEAKAATLSPAVQGLK